MLYFGKVVYCKNERFNETLVYSTRFQFFKLHDLCMDTLLMKKVFHFLQRNIHSFHKFWMMNEASNMSIAHYVN